MKKRIYFSMVIAIITSTVVTAQNAVIKFDSLSHHFGKIKEEGGKVSKNIYQLQCSFARCK